MIEFMLLGLPRSGTTWAANWLTTDKTICLHDPINIHHYNLIDSLNYKSTLGISCTASYMFPDWVNSHPARKLVIIRNHNDILKSLRKENISIPYWNPKCLNQIEADRIMFDDLFKNPKYIFEYLTDLPFDTHQQERHELLSEMHIHPNFSKVKVDRKKFHLMHRDYAGRS